MATTTSSARRGSPWLTAGWIGAAALLLLTPWAAMQTGGAVRWSLFDFAIAGAVLLACGLALEVVVRSGGWSYRIGAALAIGAGLGMALASAAVGVIGAETDPANRLYLAIGAVGLCSALAAGGRPARLVWVAIALAALTALAPMAAAVGFGSAAAFAPEVLAATAVFVLALLAAGWFFHRASRAA